LVWRGPREFVIGDTRFVVGMRSPQSPSAPPEPPADESWGWQFRILKRRHTIEQLADLVGELQPRNIFELGISEGGGTVFLTQLAQPEALVAIDLQFKATNDQLERWLESRGLGQVVRTHYGVDQADAVRLQRIVTEEFGGQPLDLVVDNASHLLDETRASFNAIFPHLRPGGIYVIERWDWDHEFEMGVHADKAFLDEIERDLVGRPRVRRPPTTILLLELVLACAYSPELIGGLTIHAHWAAVTRGDRRIDPDDFDVSICYGKGGRRLINGL
jgi:predicted O-methyltransferase YrrM